MLMRAELTTLPATFSVNLNDEKVAKPRMNIFSKSINFF